jgi:hypothetical protein
MGEMSDEVKGQIDAMEASLVELDTYFNTLKSVDYDKITTKVFRYNNYKNKIIDVKMYFLKSYPQKTEQNTT